MVMSSRSGHTSMEVFSFEPAEVVAEKSAARARAKEQAALQALRELKKPARADPGTTMEVDEKEEGNNSETVREAWGGMDMVRENSEMSMGSVEEGDTWGFASPGPSGTSPSPGVGSSGHGPSG